MRVVARSGRSAFLIELDQDSAAVLDIDGDPTLTQPSSREAILSRGYWDTFEGDPRLVLDLAFAVATEGDELPAVGWDVAGAARRLSGMRVLPEQLEVSVNV